jgi:CDP-diacylglycerol--glycerol-3-phosphate 3-phosphatidyltransferase
VASRRLTLPNLITLGRIAACPFLFWLVLRAGAGAGFWAFGLFVLAALSDLWDGYLARKHGWITDFGKLLDPLADKLLLVATLVPFYVVSSRPGELNDVPWWGPLPLWVLVVIFAREIAITVFRAYAARRGVVVAAGRSGKLKSLAQSLFAGGLLLWYPLLSLAVARDWESSRVWEVWSAFHGGWVGITLFVALVLTIYSMFDYLWSYRTLMGMRA